MQRGKSKPRVTVEKKAKRIFSKAFDSLPDGAINGLVEAALEIARKRENTLLKLRDALGRDDLNEAKRLINQIVPEHARRDEG